MKKIINPYLFPFQLEDWSFERIYNDLLKRIKYNNIKYNK